MENTKARTVEAEFLLNITDVIGDRHLVVLSATAPPLPAVTFLTLSGSPGYPSLQYGGHFPGRTAANPNHYWLHQWTPDWQSETDIGETYRNYHFAEPIGKEQWLLACARAADDSEHNVFLYDSSGNHFLSFPVGDGIEDVQVTSNESQIWVSYFDDDMDGIYCAKGLKSFNPDGTPAFDFCSDLVNKTPFPLPKFNCCYAINTDRYGDIWIYYSPHFPLVRLQNGQIKAVWTDTPVHASHSFAVTEDRALFSGGYNEKDRLYLMPLYPNSAQSETIIPVDANGDTITVTHRIVGRDSRLYLIRGNDLFVLDLRIHL